MLVLLRKPGESIKIGEGIEIKVLDIQGQKVHLGIEAPKDLKIVRPELEDRSKH